jgi:hypothetical protein
LPPSPPTPALSTADEIVAAVANAAIPRILIAPGTYTFASSGCSTTRMCVDHDVSIEVTVLGSVVLDAGGAYFQGDFSRTFEQRMFRILGSATVELIGLEITGRYIGQGEGVALSHSASTPSQLISD